MSRSCPGPGVPWLLPSRAQRALLPLLALHLIRLIHCSTCTLSAPLPWHLRDLIHKSPCPGLPCRYDFKARKFGECELFEVGPAAGCLVAHAVCSRALHACCLELCQRG